MDSFLNLTLLQPGDRLLVGVSGGADSLSLLHALAALRAELPLHVIAVHVHHGMRGEAAEADVEFLQRTCAAWDVPLEISRWEVPELARERRISVEQAGRDARYAAFRELAARLECNKVATAHHADDQAETVLLNLFRGAGIDGLAGIPASRPLDWSLHAPLVVRPLLHRTRAEIEAYCRAHALEPRDDYTNRDLRYRRNRVRHQLLPLLEEYDPAIRAHLARLAGQAREEQELLDAEAAALLQRATPPAPADFPARLVAARYPILRLEVETLNAAPAALRRRALRRALRSLAGDRVEIDADLIQRLTELLASTDGGAVDLPGVPFRARRAGSALVLQPVPARAAPVAPVPVAVPGLTHAPEFGLSLEMAEAPVPPDPRLPPDCAIMEVKRLRLPLELRIPEEGERFRPLGAEGGKSLSAFFVDRKIPREARAAWPVLADADGIVWVVGLALAERGRVGPETRRCLHVTAALLPPAFAREADDPARGAGNPGRVPE